MYFVNCLKQDPDEISLKLIPWFVSVDQSRLDIGWELRERLKNNPEDTFCLAAIENGCCKGILIAYPVNNYIEIWQARGSAGFKYAKLAFDILRRWAKSKNYKTMKLKTDKSKEAFFKRRYGFSCCGNGIMERAI